MSALIWLSWIRILIGTADPYPETGAWKLTNKPDFLPKQKAFVPSSVCFWNYCLFFVKKTTLSYFDQDPDPHFVAHWIRIRICIEIKGWFQCFSSFSERHPQHRERRKYDLPGPSSSSPPGRCPRTLHIQLYKFQVIFTVGSFFYCQLLACIDKNLFIKVLHHVIYLVTLL